MPLWKTIKGLYLKIAESSPKPHLVGYLSIEIDRVRAALRRHEAKVEDMDRKWGCANGICCPGCMFGYEYTVATEQCIRTARWFKILLRKRGRDEDLREVKRLDIEYLQDFSD